MLWLLQDLKLRLFYLNFEAWYIEDAIKILVEKSILLLYNGKSQSIGKRFEGAQK